MINFLQDCITVKYFEGYLLQFNFSDVYYIIPCMEPLCCLTSLINQVSAAFLGLIKAKKYDWKDSNMALFGSDTERQVKSKFNIKGQGQREMKDSVVS